MIESHGKDPLLRDPILTSGFGRIKNADPVFIFVGFLAKDVILSLCVHGFRAKQCVIIPLLLKAQRM